jgi:hypothetical protein
MSTIAYNALDHAVYITDYQDFTFAGQGEPDGDYIAATFVNDTVTSTEGVKGDVQDSIRVGEMGEITVTSQWGSDLNKILTQVYKDQKSSNFMKRLDVKRISNTENTTILTGLNPKIVKIPDYTLGSEAADRAWVIRVHKMDMVEVQAPA